MGTASCAKRVAPPPRNSMRPLRELGLLQQTSIEFGECAASGSRVAALVLRYMNLESCLSPRLARTALLLLFLAVCGTFLGQKANGYEITDLLKEIPASFKRVDRWSKLTPDQFLDRYHQYGLPVVYEGGALGVCLRVFSWRLEYLYRSVFKAFSSACMETNFDSPTLILQNGSVQGQMILSGPYRT